MPAQPVDHTGTFGYQGFAMVAEQADVAIGSVEPGGGQADSHRTATSPLSIGRDGCAGTHQPSSTPFTNLEDTR